MTHSQLIASLERLSGPDREVDAQIAAVFEPHRFDAPNFDPIRPIPSFHIDKAEGVIRFDGGGLMSLGYFPAYTQSVDAALALADRVLPSYQINLSKFHDGLSEASVGSRHGAQPSFGNGPAIAICIAILKAHGEEK